MAAKINSEENYVTVTLCIPTATPCRQPCRPAVEKQPCRSRPLGVAMPYPLASSSPPTCINSQLRCVTYAFIVLSNRNAYFSVSTLSRPSFVESTNTSWLWSMKFHIRSYVGIFDVCIQSSDRSACTARTRGRMSPR